MATPGIIRFERQSHGRGHKYKLRNPRCKKDTKIYIFPYRAIDIWNKLPKEFVESIKISEFKRKIDRLKDKSVRA